MTLEKAAKVSGRSTLSLIIIEPVNELSHERLHQLVGTSLQQLAHFRSRLVGKPLGIGNPVWAEVDDYDPTPQIHSATIRAPGGQREFADLIAQLSAGPHSHRKTLWDAWSIDGLEGGRWALAVKMSPALNNGRVGDAYMWSRLLDSSPSEHPSSDQLAQPSLSTPPSLGEVVTDTATEILENYVKGVWLIADAVTGVLLTAHDKLRGTSDADRTSPAVPSMTGRLPHTVFNAPLTKRRSVAFASISLADLQTVSNAFGGTIANVFLAACTLSLRGWLQRHDTVPDDPLMMEMPLALAGVGRGTFADPSTIGRIRIPVQLDDPIQVLTNLHTATERLKNAYICDGESNQAASDLACIASMIPETFLHAGMRLCSGLRLRRWLQPLCHGNVAYVSGRPMPAYCAGGRVVGMQTVAPLVEECGLNITLTSRGEVMDLSVCVCPDNVPAVDDIATGIAESVGVLVAAARKSPRGQGVSVVTEMTSHATKCWHARGF